MIRAFLKLGRAARARQARVPTVQPAPLSSASPPSPSPSFPRCSVYALEPTNVCLHTWRGHIFPRVVHTRGNVWMCEFVATGPYPWPVTSRLRDKPAHRVYGLHGPIPVANAPARGQSPPSRRQGAPRMQGRRARADDTAGAWATRISCQRLRVSISIGRCTGDAHQPGRHMRDTGPHGDTRLEVGLGVAPGVARGWV